MSKGFFCLFLLVYLTKHLAVEDALVNGGRAEVPVEGKFHAGGSELDAALQAAAEVHDQSRLPQHLEGVELSQGGFHLFVDTRVVVLLQGRDQAVGGVGAESAGEELVELQQVDASAFSQLLFDPCALGDTLVNETSRVVGDLGLLGGDARVERTLDLHHVAVSARLPSFDARMNLVVDRFDLSRHLVVVEVDPSLGLLLEKVVEADNLFLGWWASFVVLWHFQCNDGFEGFHGFHFPIIDLLDPRSALQNELLSVNGVLSADLVEVWLVLPNTFSFSLSAGSESFEVGTFPVQVERLDSVHFAHCSWKARHANA